MPKQRVIATIGERERTIELEVPSKHFTESDEGYRMRVSRFIAAQMGAMGVTTYQEGFATKAASLDGDAFQQILRARRSDGGGVTNLRSLLNPNRRRRSHRNKYERFSKQR
jgi:hypothetical protein